MEFTERKFGVEIEFLHLEGCSQSDVARVVSAHGVECQLASYGHNTVSYWKVVPDSSCGLELVSPVLSGEAGLNEIKAVCQALSEIGAKVNKRCGLHVHVDGRDLSNSQIAKVFLNYAKYEAVFDSLVPQSRRGNNNSFSKSIQTVFNMEAGYMKSFVKAPALVNFMDRYHKVNLEALARHGSIEFRQHSGTTDADKIINWVVLVIGFVEASIQSGRRFAKSPAVEPSLQTLKWFLRLTESDNSLLVRDCARYLTNRFKVLNSGLSVNQGLS